MRRLLRPAIAVAVVALLVRVEPVLGISGGLAIWAAFTWWYPSRSLGSVEVVRSHPDRVFHGEQVPVVLEAVNRGRLPVPWVSVTDPVPFDLGPSTRWITTLDPGERALHTVTLEARRRGYHLIGPAVVGGGDTFGSRRASGPGAASTGVLVYPLIVPLHRLRTDAASPLALIPSRVPLHEDPTRIVGVRDYQPGDSIRRMHWTATAHRGAPQVKLLQPGIARDVVVGLDMAAAAHPHPGRRRSSEIAVTVAASIVHHLSAVEGQAVGLRVRGVDAPTGRTMDVAVPPRPDDRHLMEMLERLARVRIDRESGSGAVLSPGSIGFGTTLVYVAGRLDREAAIALLRLRGAGVRLNVVLTGSPGHTGDWRAHLDDHGVPTTRVVDIEGVASL
jgi:uncharacterized protein (DUF58 family)